MSTTEALTVQVAEQREPIITTEYDMFGGVDVKVDGWTYVHINYDYRYTDNAARASLAEKIAAMLSGAALAAAAPSPAAEPDFDASPCERCDGEGWHWQEHQVAERATDVQTLKTHCDLCGGLGWSGPDAEKKFEAERSKVAAPMLNGLTEAKPSYRDKAQKLLDAAHDFWQSSSPRVAVRWLSASDDALVIFTRGEYRKTLMSNIDKLPGENVTWLIGEADEDRPELHHGQRAASETAETASVVGLTQGEHDVMWRAMRRAAKIVRPSADEAFSRRQFEAFHAGRKNRGAKRRSEMFKQLEDGTYADESESRHWWTWRTAVEFALDVLARQPATDPAMRAVNESAARMEADIEKMRTGDTSGLDPEMLALAEQVIVAKGEVPAEPSAEEAPLLSEEWLRAARSEVRESPEAEHTVWWILLARRIEKEIGDGYRRLHSACEGQKDELLRTWHVLHSYGKHPGRTDDKLHEVVRKAIAPPARDAGLSEQQIERAWRLGFRAACDAERLDSDEEWGFKAANVVEEVAAIATTNQEPNHAP